MIWADVFDDRDGRDHSREDSRLWIDLAHLISYQGFLAFRQGFGRSFAYPQ